MSCSLLSLMRLGLIFYRGHYLFAQGSSGFCLPYLLICVRIVWQYCLLVSFLSGIQNLKTFRSVILFFSSFRGNRPSSFLKAAFGHCLFTPRTCLQK